MANASAAMREALERNGVHYEPSAYSDEPTPITRKLIEDGRSRLVLRAPFPFAGPVRIIHGMADPDVPWRHALKVAEAFAGADVEIALVKSGDHRLSEPEDLARLVRTTGEVCRLASIGLEPAFFHRDGPQPIAVGRELQRDAEIVLDPVVADCAGTPRRSAAAPAAGRPCRMAREAAAATPARPAANSTTARCGAGRSSADIIDRRRAPRRSPHDTSTAGEPSRCRRHGSGRKHGLACRCGARSRRPAHRSCCAPARKMPDRRNRVTGRPRRPVVRAARRRARAARPVPGAPPPAPHATRGSTRGSTRGTVRRRAVAHPRRIQAPPWSP